jgi:hypothetical protein
MHLIRETRSSCSGLDCLPKWAIAHEQEANFRPTPQDFTGNLQQELVILRPNEAAHMSHHRRVGWNAQLRANLLSRNGRLKRRQVDPVMEDSNPAI